MASSTIKAMIKAIPRSSRAIGGFEATRGWFIG